MIYIYSTIYIYIRFFMIVPEMGYTTPKWLNKNGTCNDDNPTDLGVFHSSTLLSPRPIHSHPALAQALAETMQRAHDLGLLATQALQNGSGCDLPLLGDVLFFRTCQVRVSDFIRDTFFFLLLLLTANSRSQWALLDLICELQMSVGTAGPQLRAPDLSGHCRTSTVSSRAQWALPDLNCELPDLNCELQSSVGTAGPQLRAPDLSGHRRTSTASSRSQWALPDLNCELQSSVGTAGPVEVRQWPCRTHCQNSL